MSWFVATNSPSHVLQRTAVGNRSYKRRALWSPSLSSAGHNQIMGTIMKISFKDFTPNFEKKGFFSETTYEPFQDCLKRANQWIETEVPKIINVETVVLPNLWDKGEEGSEDSDLFTGGETGSSWHQFIRVWYEDSPGHYSEPPSLGG
jgi:hypothetical protein